jgi:hypothetical protein
MKGCLAHLGWFEITPEQMKAMLREKFPKIEGMVNQWGNEYGGYAYLVKKNGKWRPWFNWNAPERPKVRPSAIRKNPQWLKSSDKDETKTKSD